MKIAARLTHEKVRHDQDTVAHLVLSLTAPSGSAKRPAICIVPTIDLSGSMDGPKLEFAKRSAIKLIEHLIPGDYCGIIGFESDVHVIAKPAKIESAEDKERLKAAVGKLRIMGGTNFSGGMLKAIDLVNKLDLPASVLSRVIMLTDGQANEGVAKTPKEILKLLSANMGRVTLSAFGFGTDVSQEFLGDFAKEGKGNYAYIDQPDAALSAFGTELGGLLSTYATDIVLDLSPLSGHIIESVISDVTAEEADVTGEVNVKIPDLLAEETRHIVLAVKLSAQKAHGVRAVNVFDVKAAFDLIDATGKKNRHTEEIKVKAQFVKEGEQQDKPDADLDKIVGLAQIVRAQIEAEKHVRAGEYKTAGNVMRAAAVRVRSRGHVGLANVASKISEGVADQSKYAASESYRTSMKAGGTRGMGVASYDAEAHGDLAEAGVMFTNSLMSETSESFASPTPSPVAPVAAGAGLTGGAGASWVNRPILAVSSPVVGNNGQPVDWTGLFAPAVAEETPQAAEAPQPRRPIKQSKTSRW